MIDNRLDSCAGSRWKNGLLVNSVPPKGQCLCLSSLAGLGVNMSFTLEMCMFFSLLEYALTLTSVGNA